MQWVPERTGGTDLDGRNGLGRGANLQFFGEILYKRINMEGEGQERFLFCCLRWKKKQYSVHWWRATMQAERWAKRNCWSYVPK